MTENFPGPYELRLNYSVLLNSVAIAHQQRLNINVNTPPDPGDPFDSIEHVDGVGGLTDLEVFTNGIVNIQKVLYHSTCSWSSAELWEYTPGTNDAVFVSALGLTQVGTFGSGNIAGVQNMFVFRTQEGGTLRFNLMESGRQFGPPLSYAGLTTDEQALVDFMLGTGGAYLLLGRDTSYAFAFDKLYPGQNEALFKKRYRP